MAEITYQVEYLNTLNGERKTQDETYGFPEFDPTAEDALEGLIFMWYEGNYSCDCNRKVFAGWANADEEGLCGEPTVKVKVMHEGRVLFDDMPESGSVVE